MLKTIDQTLKDLIGKPSPKPLVQFCPGCCKPFTGDYTKGSSTPVSEYPVVKVIKKRHNTNQIYKIDPEYLVTYECQRCGHVWEEEG